MSQKLEKISKIPLWAISLISVVFLIVILYTVHSIFGIEDFSNNISLPLYIIIPGSLVISSIIAFSKSDKISEISRTSLFFLLVSFTLSLSAEQTWNLYEHVLDIDPYPSIADFFYLAAPIAMTISLAIYLKPRQHKIPAKNVIFATIISSAVVISSVLGTWDSISEDSQIEIIVALLYPVVDSVLLFAAILAILFSLKEKKSTFWLMILIGILVLIAADTWFLFLIVEDSYEDGHPVDILWIASYTIWTFMMFHIISNSKNFIQQNPEKNENNKTQKYGIIFTLVFVNGTIALVLYAMNSLIEENADQVIFSFFSWFLVIVIGIFSSVIVAFNSKLAKTIQTRTVKVEELSEDLIKSERLSAIGELSARIAHDLKNPLNNLNLALEMLQVKHEKDFDKADFEKVKIMSSSISRMNHQINEVLNFVKSIPLNLSKQSFQKLMISTMAMVQKPVNIQIILPQNDVMINCDNKIEYVFLNLINNSIDSIGLRGKIEIKIEENDKNIMLDFIDSGKGIEEKIMTQIFNPLFTTKQKGTGLGLVTCKNIIEQHGGTISVKNNPTTFTIQLPKV
ncbi:MAG: GHKL domain-containing protein [Thaumarchaeota archaeon]|nr:GHKL domain-containing protein [Nitrososphaerota archaeon]MBT6468477.1 GHKL domain-containing protein [Nitrososphaerota archaeon]